MVVKVRSSSRRTGNRAPRVILFWSFLILLLLLFSGLAKIFLGFKKAEIRRFSRTNFVFFDIKQQPLLLSLQGSEGQVFVFSGESRVLVPPGFGEYELRKVYALGELEKKGPQLVKETVQSNYKAAIFGYFYDQKQAGDLYLRKPKRFFQQVFWQAFWGKVKTDLSRYDLAVLYFRAFRLNEARIKVKNSYTEQDKFFDERLTDESFSVEILNATDHDGLAQETGKFLEKAGLRVVRSADADKNQENCEIKVREEIALSYTLWWVKRFFPCQISFTKDSSRADLVLVLGEEYWKERGEKW